MDREERMVWLAHLKVGDEVVLKSNGRFSIAKIDKITPKRQFKIKGSSYNSDGKAIGERFWSEYMCPITQEVLDQIEKETIVAIIRNFYFGGLSLVHLREIKYAIEHEKEYDEN